MPKEKKDGRVKLTFYFEIDDSITEGEKIIFRYWRKLLNMKRKILILVMIVGITCSIIVMTNRIIEAKVLSGEETLEAIAFMEESLIEEQQTGWLEKNGTWYYRKEPMGELFTGWLEENGTWYYLKEPTGELWTGWLEKDGKKYYLNLDTGAMQTGLLKISETDWYYLAEDGSLLKNDIVENYVLDETGKVVRVKLTEKKRAEQWQKLKTQIDQISRKYGAIGVSVAWIEGGEVTDTWQYGDAIQNSVAMGEDTKIRIASISKVILAINIFKMVEEGIVDLDESIGTYWGFPIRNPRYPNHTISLRSILTHTSSIVDSEIKNLEAKNLEVKLRNCSVFRSVEPSAASSWSYCNFAFGVAGTTIEKAANKTIHEISSNYFFTPMGIDAAFASGRIQNKSLLANLYYAGGSLARSRETMFSDIRSDIPGNNAACMMGGVFISAKDLAKITSILINDGMYQGERYLTEESVEIMETAYCMGSQHGISFVQCIPLDYKENIYGEEKLYFHTGSAYGVYALLSYNPENKNGVIVLTTGASGQCDSYGIYSICGEIAELLYDTARENNKVQYVAD